MTEATLIDPLTLWGTDPHDDTDCCECCDVYCPREGGGLGEPCIIGSLVAVSIDGVKYVGDPYVVVRRDLVGPIPDDVQVIAPRSASKVLHFGYARTTPALDFSAPLADRLDKAGLSAFNTEDEKIRYLALGGEMVGWTTHAKPRGNGRYAVIQVSDLPLARRIAKDCGITLSAAAAAMNATRGALA